jgi:hypothetical protein
MKYSIRDIISVTITASVLLALGVSLKEQYSLNDQLGRQTAVISERNTSIGYLQREIEKINRASATREEVLKKRIEDLERTAGRDQ